MNKGYNLKTAKKVKKSQKKSSTKLNVIRELKGKTILVTGGAGSVGSVLSKKLLEYPIKSLRVLDIDENALFKLNRALKDTRLRLLLGNILDIDRIEMAGNKVDLIIHLAAIKNIEISEFNPIEAVDVNINGTINMIKMAMKTSPKKFLNISTDKAADSTTMYGTTKLMAERLVTWAGIHIHPTTKFASARFGNVIESRGNVFEVWQEELKKGKPLSITHEKMNRYFFHVDEAVDFILKCIPLINEGEIFVPKMKAYDIKNLATKISKKQKIIGTRPGEKLSEILITKDELKRSKEKTNMWIIKPRIKS